MNTDFRKAQTLKWGWISQQLTENASRKDERRRDYSPKRRIRNVAVHVRRDRFERLSCRVTDTGILIGEVADEERNSRDCVRPEVAKRVKGESAGEDPLRFAGINKGWHASGWFESQVTEGVCCRLGHHLILIMKARDQQWHSGQGV